MAVASSCCKYKERTITSKEFTTSNTVILSSISLNSGLQSLTRQNEIRFIAKKNAQQAYIIWRILFSYWWEASLQISSEGRNCTWLAFLRLQTSSIFTRTWNLLYSKIQWNGPSKQKTSNKKITKCCSKTVRRATKNKKT